MKVFLDLSKVEKFFKRYLKQTSSFPGDVEKVEVQTDANVYRTDTFIRTYLPIMSQSFQNLNR